MKIVGEKGREIIGMEGEKSTRPEEIVSFIIPEPVFRPFIVSLTIINFDFFG